MKRAAILVIGLAVLIPFMVGVVTGVRPVDFDSTRLAPRLTGVVPEFLSYYVVEAIHPARVPLVRRGGEEVDWIELPPS